MAGDRSRKRPKGAPTHVRSFRLRLTPKQRAMVDTRFHAGVRVYNACLAEAIRRGALFHSDPAFAAAKQLPPGRTRAARFAALRSDHGFTAWSIQTFGSGLRKTWVREQAMSQETQLLAARAFEAVNRWHVGRCGKPRFKSTRRDSRGLRSMGCKDLNGALKPVLVGGVLDGLQWGKGEVLVVAPVTSKGREGREQRAELVTIAGIITTGEVLSCRIVRTMIRGKATYQAHLVCVGHPPVRHPVGGGTVSVDLGPSNIAVVTAQGDRITSAVIHPLAPDLADTMVELRRRQRHLDRQHRAGSPACFDENGKHRAGACLWRDRSTAARRTLAVIAELHRVRAEYRATAHGTLVNQLLAVGPNFRAEKLNYVAWQKNFPRSVRDRAPGMLVEVIRRKAESAGGGLYEFSPYSTALSQTCVCGARKKKPLSQRRHSCACGTVGHRDLFSAFLGLFVHPVTLSGGKVVDTLDVIQANTTWLTAHDTQWQPTSRTAVPKQRGQVRPTRRSVARIKARRSLPPKPASDGAARLEPAHTGPTALGWSHDCTR